MRIILLSSCLFFLIICQTNAQKVIRQDAADAINFIDNLTSPLKPSANNLVFYFQKQKLNATKNNDYKIPTKQVDSLRNYYNILASAYNLAIKKATENKTIDKFPGLKSKLLNMLNEGKKPWVTVIPVHIKMFSKGLTAINTSEEEIINNTSLIFKKSTAQVLELAKMLATQETSIEKKFKLELSGGLYK